MWYGPVSSFLGLLDMSSRCSGLSKQKVWPSSQAGRFRRANSPRALCPPGSFRCWDKARSAQGNLCSFSCKAFSLSAQWTNVVLRAAPLLTWEGTKGNSLLSFFLSVSLQTSQRFGQRCYQNMRFFHLMWKHFYYSQIIKSCEFLQLFGLIWTDLVIERLRLLSIIQQLLL